jgi:hypothetical protein
MATRKANRKQKKETRKQPAGASNWLKEVRSVHMELKQKNREATLKEAMKEASRRRKAKKN